MKYEVRSRKCALLVAFVLTVVLVPGVTGAEDELSSVSGFESFSIVFERNIFDPTRQPPRLERSFVPEAPPADHVALRGVLISEDAAIAFFEGTKQEYSVDAKQGDTVAGFQVAGIRTDYLTLTRDGRQTELPVGSSLVKHDDGEWELSSEGLSFSGSESTSFSGETGVTEASTETNSTGNSTNNILRRLKERRKQEMGK